MRRVPKYSFRTLTEWFHSSAAAHISILFQHFFMRTHTNLELLEEVDVVTKTALVPYLCLNSSAISPASYSEFARVFGVDFFSVLTRGSQFKVESFIFRIAKPESFVLISPSKEDVRFLVCMIQNFFLMANRTGRHAKCSRVYASYNGTGIWILHEPASRP